MTELTRPPLKRVLRILIVAEIAILILIASSAFFEDRFLPPLLQQYRVIAGEAGLTIRDWISIGFGIPALILSILAWIALWRGWRSGRRLYTLAWVIVIPAIAFTGPIVQTGPVDCLDTILSMVGGAILSLLYFSDLRQLYVR